MLKQSFIAFVKSHYYDKKGQVSPLLRLVIYAPQCKVPGFQIFKAGLTPDVVTAAAFSKLLQLMTTDGSFVTMTTKTTKKMQNPYSYFDH